MTGVQTCALPISTIPKIPAKALGAGIGSLRAEKMTPASNPVKKALSNKIIFFRLPVTHIVTTVGIVH